MKLEVEPNANDSITPHEIFAVGGPMVARAVTLAEAMFIARTVNSHEQLVAACKAVIEDAQAFHRQHGISQDDEALCLKAVRAALAAAEAK